MTTPNPADVATALLDVRKAYRLLHDYQRMVLNAMGHIESQLGFRYQGGYSKFSNVAPRDGKGALDCWAWDWLNMMLYEFHFRNDAKRLRMSIVLISDTGYFQEDNSLKHEDRTAVSKFASPERSRTMIGFVVSAKDWPNMAFIGDRESMRAFINEGGKLPPALLAKGLLGRCYDLSCIITKDSTDAMLDDLIKAANLAGIPLERVALAPAVRG